MASAPLSVRAFVRRYNPATDYQDVVNICKATSHKSIQTVTDIVPYIYAVPYITLQPDTAFVLDTGGSGSDTTESTERLRSPVADDRAPEAAHGGTGAEYGRVVGYIIGTPDTRTFVERYKTEYIPTLPSGMISAATETDSPPEYEQENLRSTFLRILHDPAGAMLHAQTPEFIEKFPAHLHINILPSHQGKGYGPELIEKLVKEVKSKGAKGIHLGMRADNLGAGRFYERQGFERTKLNGQCENDGATWMVRGFHEGTGKSYGTLAGE